MSAGSDTWPVELHRRRVANGGWEWFFTLGGEPIYPNPSEVGIFTDPDVSRQEAFARVLRQWGWRR